jgi:hypothetical protein
VALLCVKDEVGYLLGVMDASNTIQAQPVRRRSLLKELCALLLFVIVAGMLAMPCLCVEGSIAGRYKSILFLLVSLRLAWCIYRRTFRFRDYFAYFGIVIAFCLWAEVHHHH